jgi:DNA-binding MarR family transcriptional regulator
LASLPNTLLEQRNEFPEDRTGTIVQVENCACAALRKASRAVTQLYDLVLVPTGLKATQFLMLKTIFDAGEIAQCDFAREHAIAIETLSRRFANLREKGLVQVRIGMHHSERIYRLTPCGRKHFEDAVPYWLLAQSRLKTTLGEADWRVLQGVSNRVSKAAIAAELFRTSNHHASGFPALATSSAMARRKLYNTPPK